MSKYLNRVLEVNTEERWALIEPGAVQEQFNLHLKPMGYLFGPDTSTANRATVGGMMGNNSAGSHSIIYGKTIDHVLEMDVVLSSGERRNLREIKFEEAARMGELEASIATIVTANREEIERRYPKIMRRVSGYNLDEFVRNGKFNLSKLVVGSEGTLATVHQAKVRIEPRPAATAVMVVHFTDIVDAIRATVDAARGRDDHHRTRGMVHTAGTDGSEDHGRNAATTARGNSSRFCEVIWTGS